MLSRSHHELVVVAGKLQGRSHLLIREGPVSMQVVEVILTVLEEYPDRFGICLANQGRVDMTSSDVRETPDVADHLAKGIRTWFFGMPSSPRSTALPPSQS